jgi:hypothetical protein
MYTLRIGVPGRPLNPLTMKFVGNEHGMEGGQVKPHDLVLLSIWFGLIWPWLRQVKPLPVWDLCSPCSISGGWRLTHAQRPGWYRTGIS